MQTPQYTKPVIKRNAVRPIGPNPAPGGLVYKVDFHGWSWRVLKWTGEDMFLKTGEKLSGCYDTLCPATENLETKEEAEAWIYADRTGDYSRISGGSYGKSYRSLGYDSEGNVLEDTGLHENKNSRSAPEGIA